MVLVVAVEMTTSLDDMVATLVAGCGHCSFYLLCRQSFIILDKAFGIGNVRFAVRGITRAAMFTWLAIVD